MILPIRLNDFLTTPTAKMENSILHLTHLWLWHNKNVLQGWKKASLKNWKFETKTESDFSLIKKTETEIEIQTF